MNGSSTQTLFSNAIFNVTNIGTNNGTYNVTNNGTFIDSSWPYVPIQPKQGLILFIIVLTGTAANTIAFLATLKLAMKQKSAINVLIIALTITDTYGIVFCALPTLLCYLKRQWIGGVPMCNFQGVSTMFASLASGLMATAMAIERLFAIWKPFLYREMATKRKALFTIFIIWSTTLAIALFPLVKEGNFVRNLTGTYCTINWFAKSTENIAYAVFYIIMGIVLIIIVLFCNISIAVRLFSIGKNRENLRADSAKKRLMEKTSDAGVDENGKRKVAQRSSSAVEIVKKDLVKIKSASLLERQLAKTVAVISILFVICWAPFTVSLLGNSHQKKHENP